MTTTQHHLLPDRPLTPEERTAHDEDPRPGVWAGQIGVYYGAKEQGDLRSLTQDQTDRLIRIELLAEHSGSERPEIERVIDSGPSPHGDDCLMVNQRGGIDSDPLVRLLAFRAWGDRDRRWFEERPKELGPTISNHASQLSKIQSVTIGAAIPLVSSEAARLRAEFKAKHQKLHEEWTAAVGAPSYVKKLWTTRDNALVREYHDALTALGYPHLPLLPQY